MWLAQKSPGSVSFSADELWRFDRARVAVVLGVPPGDVDNMPLQDAWDVLAVDELRRHDWFTALGQLIAGMFRRKR